MAVIVNIFVVTQVEFKTTTDGIVKQHTIDANRQEIFYKCLGKTSSNTDVKCGGCNPFGGTNGKDYFEPNYLNRVMAIEYNHALGKILLHWNEYRLI